jgi:cell wall-associated NlpC family hydrolase
MKWLLAIMTSLTLVLVGCTSSTSANASQLAKDGKTSGAVVAASFVTTSKPHREVKMESPSIFLDDTAEILNSILRTALDEQEQIRIAQEKIENQNKMESLIEKVKAEYVGKVWYVFAGSTPNGWDCSGFTMWFYGKFGVDLYHGASSQKHSGQGYKVKTPKVGDLVALSYYGSHRAYHVGIYAGDGKMIHSPNRGRTTSISSIEAFGGSYSKATYVRFIETP